MKRLFLFFFLPFLLTAAALAQLVRGVVTDEGTGEAIPFVNVYYNKGERTQTDTEGRFSIRQRGATLHFSLVGYKTKQVKVTSGDSLHIRLAAHTTEFSSATVTAKKNKYSRKNNPAVELMRRVIAAKERYHFRATDFYSVNKYSKMVFALNEVEERLFGHSDMGRFAFLKKHIETSKETGKRILPISVEEVSSREIYRRSPEAKKTIVTGQRQQGINDLINTGEILNTMLHECFSDVNIYEDHIRLLRHQFLSPISQRGAIQFYRYFIEDTVRVGNERAIHLTFTPNNPQDFGFSGDLYVLADSSYRVVRADLGVPVNSSINWVERMTIHQDFTTLPTGEQVLAHDDLIIQLKVTSFIQKLQVRRTTDYSDFSSAPIPEKDFRFRGNTRTEADAFLRSEDFWKERRSEELSQSEEDMGLLIKRLQSVKGFKYGIFVVKAFIENFIETSTDPKKPSKVDIGPVNTIISQSQLEGLRLRASAQTTAFLHPHLFAKGYLAYGFKDRRWKGMGELTYSFNKKAYLPREFPVNNLVVQYQNDLIRVSDPFIPTDKDNVFASFKWSGSKHLLYNELLRLSWDREWANGLRLNLQLRSQRQQPTGSLFYQLLGTAPVSANPADHLSHLRMTDLTLQLQYQPGATFINTKQRRISVNKDIPIYSFSHTMGVKGVLGNRFTYNLTEAGVYKRVWFGSWGDMRFRLKGGVQWNKVPFPLLIIPASNLSYLVQEGTFNLIDNMEFLNDRYASFMYSWDINGKIFNRIPLLKKLKWREYIGFNVLWGQLSDKNSPWKNPTDPSLMHFPGTFQPDGSFEYLSSPMDPKRPYLEAMFGIHNIFKVFHIQYVRRLSYLNNPDTKRWGIRIKFHLTF